MIDADGGRLLFRGQPIQDLRGRALKALRPQIQMIFQDPFASLNPRHRVGRIVTENAVLCGVPVAEAQRRMHEVLQVVGLDASAVERYPHEFSGGQRQRIGIARALALSPHLVVADEPVSALDLSIRAQVVNLLADLQRQLGLAYLFIAHDLTLVRHVCHRVAVMRRGKIVELAETEELFAHPLSPYTQALLEAIPIPDPRRARRDGEDAGEQDPAPPEPPEAELK